MLTADSLTAIPRLRHAFFTREGGASGGIYASLNCGYGSSDEPRHVAVNRDRAARQVGCDHDRLVTVYQVHGTAVIEVTRPWAPGEAPRADAMVTRTPGIALGILTADCAPLLVADRDAGVVGAAHAGWRGALAGVAESTVAAMAALGARRERILAAIGPCIGPGSYEVGPEFPAPFIAQDEANRRFFAAAARAGHFMFDLPGYLGHRLAALGLAGITRLDHDTCVEEERFFSYRRACLRGETDYGRGLSAIALAE